LVEMSMPQPYRDRPIRLAAEHGRRAQQLEVRAPRARLDEAHLDVVTVRDVEVDVDHLLDRVEREQRADEERARYRNADARERRAQREANDLPQYHPRLLVEDRQRRDAGAERLRI